MTDTPEQKRVNYLVPEALHRRMRVLAAKKGISLKAWHEAALLAEVERQEADEERRRRSR